MKHTKVRFTTQMICFIGLFGALSAVLMMFKIPLFFAPAFMKLDFAELPCILGGFMFGPISGVAIVLVKLIINLLLNGTDSMYVGEISNLLLSSTYVLTASLLYRGHKTKKRAAVSLLVSVVVTSLVSVLSNTYFTFPAYATVYGLSMDSIVEMTSAINPLVKDVPTLMIFSVLPFNLVKFGLVAVITFLVYKKLHLFIKQYILKQS